MQLRLTSVESALHEQARCLHISCHVSNSELRGLLRPNGPSKLVALRSVLACRIQALSRATDAAGGYVDAAAIHCQPQQQVYMTHTCSIGCVLAMYLASNNLSICKNLQPC